MLYLRQSADAACGTSPGQVPIAELTAFGLERALLAADIESRRHELIMILMRDPAVAEWAMNAAARRLGCDRLGVDEAAAWLAGCLEAELAAALNDLGGVGAHSAHEPLAIEVRLPALARRLAQLKREVDAFDARLEREKIESLKELAYGASHEINNPLANIAARAQTLLQDKTDPERRRKLLAIHRQAMRAHEMIADLMLFARPPKLQPAAGDLRPLLAQVVDELQEIARDYEAELIYAPGSEGDTAVVATIDATQIAVAVRAVVTNALEAVGEGGHVEIGLKPIEVGGMSWAEIAVRDDGPGISHEVRRHLFDPFFSGREAGRGLGFGLSKCWRIVTDHGGEIVVHQPAQGGAEFVIRLPLAADELHAK